MTTSLPQPQQTPEQLKWQADYIQEYYYMVLGVKLYITKTGRTYSLTTKSTTHTYTTIYLTHLTHGTGMQQCRRHTP